MFPFCLSWLPKNQRRSAVNVVGVNGLDRYRAKGFPPIDPTGLPMGRVGEVEWDTVEIESRT